jgi:predicted transcriptional regulator
VPAVPSQQTTSLKLDALTRQRVRRLAEACRRSPHWVMREAIMRCLAQEELREQLRQDALAAWTAYRPTGLHATGEEVDAWLVRLEAGEEGVDPPACHP